MNKNMKRVVKALFMVLATVMMLSVPASAASSKTVATIKKKSYSSLEDAVKDVKDGQTIKLQKNVKTNGLTLNRNKKYTINLNGYKITPKSIGFTINVKKGTVTFKNGTIGCHITVYKNAKLTMSSIKMQSKYKPSLQVKKKGKATIKSGTYYAIGNYGTLSIKKGTFYGVINNWKDAKLTITDGTFKPQGTANCVTNTSGSVTISGGTFTNSDNHLILSNSDSGASMTITGGTFTLTPKTSGPMVENWRNAKLNISGSAKFTVKNGSSNVAISVIDNGPQGILNISGGTFENLNTSRTYMHVIYNWATFKMSGGTLTASGSDSYALYNSGSATLTGGNLYSKRSYKVCRSGAEGESLSYNSKVNLNEADIYR